MAVATLTRSLLALSLPLFTSGVKTSRTFAVNRIQGKGLVYGRMDPIISPGTDSAHAHMVVGGNGFSDNMGDLDALRSTCTNSLIKADGSNYWVPQLYFHDGDNFTSVEMDYMNVYYFFEPTDDDILPFEPGFRMISGNPFTRAPPSTGGASILDPAQGTVQPVQFTCPMKNGDAPRYPPESNGLGGVGIQDPNNKGAGAGFPNVNCDGFASPLRVDVHFPSCYNPAAGLANYQNNTAWPSSKGATGGRQNCPEGMIHVPHLFYEIYWNTPAFKDQWTQGGNTQPFVLAPGDPTGYGSHGDFFSGWDKEALQAIINTCDAGDSGMDKCPQIPGGLVSPEEASNCKIKAPNPEQVLGTMKQLPGCNPLNFGPAPASPNPPGCPAQSSGSSPSNVPSTSASSSQPSTGPSSSTPVSTGIPAATSPLSSHPAGPSSGFPSGQPSNSPSPVHTSIPSSGSSPPASSQTGSGPTGWVYSGCYVDSKSTRALPGPTENLMTSMTIDKCTDFCSTKGYTFAGLEWKSECYCGNSMPSEQSDACTDPCAGDQGQMCGGWNAISVYKKASNAKRHSRHMAWHARHGAHSQ